MFNDDYTIAIYAHATDPRKRLRIVYDLDPQDPQQEWDNVATICFDKEDCGAKTPDYMHEELLLVVPFYGYLRDGVSLYLEDDFNRRRNINGKAIHMKGKTFTRYFLDCHPRMTKRSDFEDYSDRLGVVYVTKKDWDGIMGKGTPFTKEKALKIIEEDLKTMEDYLTGQVFGYIEEELATSVKVKKNEDDEDRTIEEWETVGSCFGYYGDYEDLAKEQGYTCLA